jgi:mRNA interferase MazF
MQRGEIWFAATPGGDRPVLVLTRDPVADRIASVVVAALTRTERGLVSELPLTTASRRRAWSTSTTSTPSPAPPSGDA